MPLGPRLLKKHTGLFLGAGFSKWAAGLPLVHELFDFEISEIRANDQYWIHKLKTEKQIWDRSHPSESNEQFIQYVILKKGVLLNKYLSKYLARRLSEPFLCKTYTGIQTFMFNDSKIHSLESINTVKNFFSTIEGSIKGIITVNYDLIVEYALGTKKFTYGANHLALLGRGNNPLFPWQNIPVYLTGNIILSKLHGSLSYDGENYWTSGICGLNGKALIVPPSPEKHMHKLIAQEWDSAKTTLKSIDTLIIFGFNFNSYDTAVLNLLSQNSATIERVIIYDVASKIEKARPIWPNALIEERDVSGIIENNLFPLGN